MIFKGRGNRNKPVILLLHGGGLSDWSLENVAKQFACDYYVVTTIIDGHGEDGRNAFISIAHSANQIIQYIKGNLGGNIHAICGLSIGAQIICEMLAKEISIVKFAVLESPLVYPMKVVTALTVPMYQCTYGLIQKRWFSKWQAKALCVPDCLFETYYQDSLNMTKQSLINITKSNGNYSLQSTISNTTAKVLVIVGEKEIGVMKKSAKLVHQKIKHSTLLVVPNLKHGEFSLAQGHAYTEVVNQFIK